MTTKSTLIDIAQVFLKLGCFAFGGPAAHIAMMEEEVVEKRGWMSRQHFLDLMGATNLIPGPNSTEMTMHCGHERGGIPGLFVAGICFIFPAVVITSILAWLYVTYHQLPGVAPWIFGIKPAVIAIIASAVFKLGKKALKNWELGILGFIVLLASLVGVHEIVALLSGGILGGIYFGAFHPTKNVKTITPLLFFQIGGSALSKITTIKLFWTFLKVGAVLYGSGYVLFAYLEAELVHQQWLSRSDLMDAIAVGQFTPGPVLSTATFIGYQLAGWRGAIAATLGIFLPSFLFVWLLNPIVPKMRSSKWLSGFLDSVNVAAVAVMAAVLLVMIQEVLYDWRSGLIAAIGLILTFSKFQLNAMWIVSIGAVMGYLLHLLVF